MLAEFKEAGLGSLPGGGAEIFHPEVRDKICEHKADADAWLRIHREAHELGLRSNATMLYGHIEKPGIASITCIRLRRAAGRDRRLPDLHPAGVSSRQHRARR